MHAHAGICHGRALVLAPYFAFFESHGGDESEEIAAILRAAGYEVTFKCDVAAVCPDGGVTVEDFKSLGEYSAVSVSTHGDSAQDGSNTVILTQDIYTHSYRGDWLAGLIEVRADNTMVLTPLFFSAYTNQIKDLIVYMSACR
jgi:hypothetical protein